MSPRNADPRIHPVDPPYDPEVAIDLEKLMPPGIEPLKIFRTLANHPEGLVVGDDPLLMGGHKILEPVEIGIGVPVQMVDRCVEP